MTARTLVARVTPPALVGRRRAVHILERNYVTSKAVWSVILSGFFEPLFYLLAIGVGIGELTGDIELPGGEIISYAAYVAPALLAASAMNGAVLESTINIFFKLKYGKTYDAILATPMEPADVAVGEIGWSLVRGGLYAAAFFGVMLAMGLVLSPWGILAVPAALLVGFGFAGVGMAASTYMRTWQDLDLVNLILLPMFLFSGTFFPVDIYPPVLQIVTRLSPLFHAVRLIRGLTLGEIGPELLVHAGFLAAMGAIGLAVAGRRISAMLLK
jgi:lipooligosaccharide transport system permease protein